MGIPDIDLNSPFYVLTNKVDPNSTLPVVTIGGQTYNLVAASFLPNPTGQSPYVVDPNQQNLNPDGSSATAALQIYQYNSSGELVPVQNPSNYLVFPADFSLASAQTFASNVFAQLHVGAILPAAALMYEAFKEGGLLDLQRNYDGQTWDINPNMNVQAFQDAASWTLGFVAQQAGLGATIAIGAGGLYNEFENHQWLPGSNYNSINAGANFGSSLPSGSINTDVFDLSVAGLTIDGGSALIPGNNNQITLSGLNDTLTLSGSNDTFNLTGPGLSGALTLSGNATVTIGPTGSTLVQTGNGNNTITGTIPGLTLDLGNGNNLVGSVGPGTIVNVQSNGVDQFVPSADELINGSTASDQLIGGNGVLHGAVGEVGSQDPWVVGPNQVRYSINTDGDLVVQTPFEAAMNNGMTFISGYVGGPDVPLSEQTDGIFVGLAKIEVSLLVDLTRPFNEDIPTWFKLGNELYYTLTGTTIFNADPLVFDLTGGGINLTALSSVAPKLDVEDTG